MSHLLQCTRGIWITKVGVSLRFLQLPIHLQQLEGIKSHIILGAWSSLVSWPFIPPDTLYPSTSAGKFLPHPLLRAKKRGSGKRGVQWLKGKDILSLWVLSPYRCWQSRRRCNYQEAETIRTQAQTISGIFYWQDDSGPHTTSGKVPFPPKSQHERFLTTWGGSWTIAYYHHHAILFGSF